MNFLKAGIKISNASKEMNILQRFISKFEIVVERTNEFEDKSIKIAQTKKQRYRRMEKTEHSNETKSNV